MNDIIILQIGVIIITIWLILEVIQLYHWKNLSPREYNKIYGEWKDYYEDLNFNKGVKNNKVK